MKTLKGHIKLKKWNPKMVWAGDPEYIQITRILMSTGDGESWHEYVQRSEIVGQGLIRLINHRGKPITLNSKWIVKAEDFTVVKVAGLTEIAPGVYDEKIDERLYLAEDDISVELVA